MRITNEPEQPVLLRLDCVSKRFGAALAVDGVSLTVRRGEVLGLLGENGAGKSTLMEVVFGGHKPDAGLVEVADASGRLRRVPPGSPRAALSRGVGMVHQHFTLAMNLTVLESVVLGARTLFAPSLGLKRARAGLERLMADTGLEVPLDAKVADLSVGERQRVEILKALYRGARVLILDEPTAVLTPLQAERLGRTVALLAGHGMGVVLISHKLDEVLSLCDRVAVLRRGRKVLEAEAARTTKGDLATAMIDRDLAPPPPPRSTPAGAAVLEVQGLSVEPAPGREPLHGVSFNVFAGEIFGVAGVSGNGQRSLAAVLSGVLERASGGLRFTGVAWPADKGSLQRGRGLTAPAALTAAGVGRIPEDRQGDGLIGDLALWENLALEDLEASTPRRAFLPIAHLRARAAQVCSGHDVRGPGADGRTAGLSGGNAQKLVVARALERGPKLLVASQPARGLDVGAVAEVHRRLRQARDAGTAVLLISDDLDEIMALADRVAVMHRGRLSKPVKRADADLAGLGLLMAGETGKGTNNPARGGAKVLA